MFAIEEIVGLIQNRDCHNKEPLMGKEHKIQPPALLYLRNGS